MNDLTLPIIITGAAADSINPCVIGVLVFLVTFLASVRAKKWRLFAIGMTYIVTVYICYMLLGIGLIKLISKISFWEYVGKFLGFVIVAAGLVDIYDGITKNPKPLLSIPKSAAPRIKKLTYKGSVPAAVVLALFATLVELPCSGYVYFSITEMMSEDGLTFETLALLGLYNFIFVLPPLIILGLAIAGLSSDKIEGWRKGNKAKMRIVTGIAMVVFGLLMVIY